MTETPRHVRESPENPSDARRGRQGLKTPMDPSSQGWTPPDRAPRLRRAADVLMMRARLSEDPAKVRRLARDMRLRAAAIELGAYDLDDFEQYVAEFRSLAGPSQPRLV